MFTYFFVFFTVTIIGTLLAYNKNNHKLGLFLSFLVLLFFMGTRYNVGRDYPGYEGLVKDNMFNSYEPGQAILVQLSNLLGDTQWYFFITSFLTLLPLYLILKKESPRFSAIAILVSQLVTIYPLGITTVRQTVSIMLFMYALYVTDFNKIKLKSIFSYLLLVLLAISFHASAIVLFPFLILLNDKVLKIFSGKILISIVVVGVILGYMGFFVGDDPSELISTIELGDYSGYVNRADKMEFSELNLGPVTLIKIAFYLLPLFWYDKIVAENHSVSKYFVLYAIGLAVFYAIYGNDLFARISYYFLEMFTLAFPYFMIYIYRKQKAIAKIVLASFVVFYMATLLIDAEMFFDLQIYEGAKVLGLSVN